MFGSFLAIVIKGNYDVGGAGIVFDRNYQSGRIGELGLTCLERGRRKIVVPSSCWLRSGEGQGCLPVQIVVSSSCSLRSGEGQGFLKRG
jgi:hypothetical protein